MNEWLLSLYSVSHFWVDLSCALLLFRTLLGSPDLALCLLVYNFCAFALQMPFGLLADRPPRGVGWWPWPICRRCRYSPP